ncbi:MAG: M48 family metallopeptidase [Zoogloeaceae bacterium]|jgi:putative metalloprotease|nr:M48 family metallopeptidase [Zoogloeaceae bacterium]
MNRRNFILFSALASGISSVTPVAWALDFGKAMDVGKKLSDAESVSDEDLKTYFDQMAAHEDTQNKVAGPETSYGKRLAKLTNGLNNYNGLDLNFKAYQTSDINAFAMANGAIRLYSGLMDEFTDDEIRYVIGHEIGHIQSGHTKARIQMAMRTSALRSAVSATDGKAAKLADSQLGDLFEKVILAQHSQSNEREADDRAMNFMKTLKYDPNACVSALDKLDNLSGGGGASWLSTHPSPKERANRMRTQLAA